MAAQSAEGECRNCGQAIDNYDDLFCPYCGTKNENFSLEGFNQSSTLVFAEQNFQPYTDLSQVENCESRDGASHQIFQGFRESHESDGPQPKYCFHCGKKLVSD